VELPARVVDAAADLEQRLAGMSDAERVRLLNELLAWLQVQILSLYPD